MSERFIPGKFARKVAVPAILAASAFASGCADRSADQNYSTPGQQFAQAIEAPTAFSRSSMQRLSELKRTQSGTNVDLWLYGGLGIGGFVGFMKAAARKGRQEEADLVIARSRELLPEKSPYERTREWSDEWNKKWERKIR